MARETKAERIIREQAEQEAMYAEFIALYPERLMSALERACKHGWDLSVSEGSFQVSYYDSYNDRETITMPPTVSEYNSWGAIDQLESELHSADLREAEYKRKAMVRQAGLSKLTPEEREELGL